MIQTLIKSGTIIDGTGKNPPFTADIAIDNGIIVNVASHISEEAENTIDASGLYVAPGFIDVHSHDDLAVLHDKLLPNKLLQGVTTTIVGNCGQGITPVAASAELRSALRTYVEPVLGVWPEEGDFGFSNVPHYINAIRENQNGLNVGVLIAHGPLRIRVMGFSDSVASQAQIAEMCRLLQEGMAAGALGLSLGLMYSPGCFADQQELVALAEVVKSNQGLITSHIRGEGDLLLPSIQEMIDISEATGVSMHISHLKAVGIRNWGTVQKAIEMIDKARARGLDITCDVYPYSAGSTTILSLLPPWALQGGVESALERVNDEATRLHIIRDLQQPGEDWDNVAFLTGFDRIVLASTPSTVVKPYEGLTFAEIAKRMESNDVEAYLRIIAMGGGRDTIVIHHMDENDVRTVIQYQHSVIGSDGLPSPDGHPHPRLYGTFPRFLSKYVREEQLLSIEEAIHKITSLSTERFHLSDRGVIAPGYRADIVGLNFKKISDLATYTSPREYSEGIEFVLVNGRMSVRDGKLTNETSGAFLSRG